MDDDDFLPGCYLADKELRAPIHQFVTELQAIARGSKSNEMRCPNCSTAYDPFDYRSNVSIFCSVCGGEQPRRQA